MWVWDRNVFQSPRVITKPHFFFCDFWRMWSVADECPFYPFIVKITLSNHHFEMWANSGALKRMDTVVLFIDVCN